VTALDLRLGAGFIYEVWVQKSAAKQQALQQERKKAIYSLVPEQNSYNLINQPNVLAYCARSKR